MKKRRAFPLVLIAGFMALAVVVAPAIADELLGVLTKVNIEGKKLTVVEKGSDKEVEVTVNDDTEWVTPKGASKIDLEKVSKRLEKTQSKGAKGIPVKVTHEKAVASKIESTFRKKAQ